MDCCSSKSRVARTNPVWRSLRTTLKPLLHFSRALGCTPLKLSESGPPEVSGVGYALSIASLVTVTEVYAIVSERGDLVNQNFKDAVWAGVMLLNRITMVAINVALLVQRSTVVAAVGKVVELDEELRPPSNYHVTILSYLQLGAFHCLLIAGWVNMFMNSQLESWSFYAFVLWRSYVTSAYGPLLLSEWTTFVMCLIRDLDALTAELLKMYPISKAGFLEVKQSSFGSQWNGSIFFEEISGSQDNQHLPNQRQENENSVPSISIADLRRFHRGIYDALQKLQTVYGVPMTFIAPLVILNTVATVLDQSHSTSIIDIGWVLFLSWILITGILPCQMLLNKAHSCAEYLHTIMQLNVSPEERKQLLAFSAQMLDLPLTCTACNLFQLDNRVLISILGTTATYVIILFEFDTVELSITGLGTSGYSAIQKSE